jgi:hypothetical protein
VWFLGAVKNAYQSWSRYQTRSASEAISEIPTGDTTFAQAEALSAAQALMRSLPPAYRKVARMEMAGCTREEMMDLGTPKRVIDDARARIKQMRRLVPDKHEYVRVLRAYKSPSDDHEGVRLHGRDDGVSNTHQPQIDRELERYYMGTPGGSTEPMDERRALALHETHMAKSKHLMEEVQMSIFEFECPKGHVTDMMIPLALRPNTKTCGHEGCEEEAKFVLSATPTTFRAQDRKAFKRQGH